MVLAPKGPGDWDVSAEKSQRVSAAQPLLESVTKPNQQLKFIYYSSSQESKSSQRMLWETSQVRTFPELEPGMLWQLKQLETPTGALFCKPQPPAQRCPRDVLSGWRGCRSHRHLQRRSGCCPLLAHIPLLPASTARLQSTVLLRSFV